MMQDNSFDKNIKHTLEGLNITPSPSVWNEVEKELDRKKRRYFFLWWLLPLLIIGGSIVLYTTNKQQNADASKVAANETSITIPVQKEVAIEEPKTAEQKEKLSGTKDPQHNETISHDVVVPVKPSLKINFNDHKSKVYLTASGSEDENINKYHSRKRYLQGKTIVSIQPSVPVDDEEAIQIIADTPVAGDNIVNKEMSNKIADTMQISQTNAQKQTEARPLPTEISDSLLSKTSEKKEKSTKNSWEKKWAIGGGYAGLGSLKIGASANEAFFNNGGVTNPGSGSAIRISNKYSFNNGIFLQAGFVLNRTLSNKIKLGTGLQYNFQHINVNRIYMVDSMILTSMPGYANISTTVYKESLNIHAIDIPVLLNFSLSNRISLNAGVINRFQYSSQWKKYEPVLGSQKTYLPLFHFNPEFMFRQFSAGPVINIGLGQYNNGSRMLNFGLSLKYSPKK